MALISKLKSIECKELLVVSNRTFILNFQLQLNSISDLAMRVFSISLSPNDEFDDTVR